MRGIRECVLGEIIQENPSATRLVTKTRRLVKSPSFESGGSLVFTTGKAQGVFIQEYLQTASRIGYRPAASQGRRLQSQFFLP